jgi:glycosyltransferase involved in cell wall biosynthesis
MGFFKKTRSGKKKLAFLGGGAHTIPSYRALLEGLTREYDVIVYFEFFLEITQAPYQTRMISRNTKFRRWRELRFFLLILNDLFTKQFDIIHCHSTYPSGFFGIVLGKLFRLPVVVSLDAAEASALPEIGFGDLLNSRRRAINKWVIKEADAVIALTGFLKTEVNINLGVQRPIEVIPRGVDRQKFKFTKNEITKPLRILNVAYLNAIKDQETLLKAFSIINASIASKLIQIGKDYSNGSFQLLAKDLGIADHVEFKGFIPNEFLPPYYENAQILLHTSRYESQAVVVNEALASGLLVCGTHVGLLADLNGLCCTTVKPGDYRGLADVVINLVMDRNRVEELKTRSYEWTMKHDLHWTIDRHLQLYKKLLSSSI